MKSILLICPYFGEFPNYFPLWLKTASHNETIDFIIPTDHSPMKGMPGNVRFLNTTLEEMKTKIEHLLEMKISLTEPYKLCDYKPVYGMLFYDIVSQYDFWGYCDLDLIFGDLRTFFTDQLLSSYDKIYRTGQLTIFKQNKETVELFLDTGGKELGDFTYKEAFTTPYICHFDESAICKLAELNNLKQYNVCEYADVFAKYYNFVRCGIWDGYNEQVFEWENGKLTRLFLNGDETQTMELAYVHLQKRKMKFRKEMTSTDSFTIIPNAFIPKTGIVSKSQLHKYGKKRPNIYYYRKRFKSYFQKIKNGAIKHRILLYRKSKLAR